MPLINCPECKKEISAEAVTCPNCGYPIRKINPKQPSQQITTPPPPAHQKKKGHGCLISMLIIIFMFGASIAFGITQMQKNPERYAKKSTLAKTMELDSDQESNILKIFTDCGIGEITSVSVIQSGEEQTSYHLNDKETAGYNHGPIVVWINNKTKTLESIYYQDQDIYIDNTVIAPVTDYYINSTDKSEYRVASQLAVKQILNYPDTAKFPSISGWAFNIEDGIIIVQSEVTAKNAFNMESTSKFQVKFDSGNIVSLIMEGQEYIN